MVDVGTIATFDLVVGSVAAIGLAYLLYSRRVRVHYRRFFRLVTLGLLFYAATGPVIGTFAPALIHAIHGTATLFIALGLYDLIRRDIRPEDDFDAVFSGDVPENVPPESAGPESAETETR